MNATTLNWTAAREAAAYGRTINAARIEKAVEGGFECANHIAMFVAAPLIGLVFAVALPLVGLAMLAWMAVRALPKRAKDIALFAAAPFIGLIYIAAFPVIGFGALAWAGIKAAKAK